MAGSFDGLRVLITGASSGLGRAIAVACAREGAAHLTLNYAGSAEGAAETAAQVAAQGAASTIVQGDVGEDADCRRIAATAADAAGGIDVLFNNAGVTSFCGHANLDGVNADDFLRIYRINVVGAFQMIRACRNWLEANPTPGAVVNSASIAGLYGIGSSVPYAASKAAMINMTVSLARALAPRIRVNAICPGYIDTPWFGKALPDAFVDHIRQQTIDTTPMQVASTPEDIADSAIFLGGRHSRHITGETLLADAGMHLTLTPIRAPANR